jgi:hypothetical protein
MCTAWGSLLYPGIQRSTGLQGVEIITLLLHHRIMYTSNILQVSRTYFSLAYVEKSADFGFFWQRDPLECPDLNHKPSPDFKGIDSIPLSSNGRLYCFNLTFPSLSSPSICFNFHFIINHLTLYHPTLLYFLNLLPIPSYH